MKSRAATAVVLAGVATAALLAGPSGCGEAFEASPPGTGGATLTTRSSSSTTTSGAGGTTTSSEPLAGTGGAGGTTIAGGNGGSAGHQGGEGGGCLHDECVVGAALEATCSACATAVCGVRPECCSAGSAWDLHCVVLTDTLPGCDRSCGGVCESLLGDIESFVLCDEGAAQCRFEEAELVSCKSLCNSHGLSCLQVWARTGACTYSTQSPLGCDEQPGDGLPYVCACAKACGIAPPCRPTEVCSETEPPACIASN